MSYVNQYPLRGASNNALIGLIKPPALPVVMTGSFSATGIANSFSREILIIAGENKFLLLLLGAVTSFILGIGMTVTACYVFLAVVLVPALVKIGFDPMASHLFVMFCGNLSYITPPVALGAISASAIAGTNPMATGFSASKLGILLFILPFIFVMNPALIFRADFYNIIQAIITSIIGTVLMAGSLEGWIFKLGHLKLIQRIVFFSSGIMIVYPEGITDIIGFIIAFFSFGIFILTQKRVKNLW